MENEVAGDPPIEQVDPAVNLDYINQQSTGQSSPLNGLPKGMIVIGIIVFVLFILIIIVGLMASSSKKSTSSKLTPTAKKSIQLSPTVNSLIPTESNEEEIKPTVKMKVIQEIIVGSNGTIVTPTVITIKQQPTPTVKIVESMTLASSAFNNGDNIPIRYSCRGDDINPPLTIGNIPKAAKSLVIIVDDLDANNFAHWLVWNINPATKEIKEGFVSSEAMEGTNDFEKAGYKGPCPPDGETHNYRFTVYALDNQIILDSESKLSQLTEIISNRIINKAELKAKFRLE